MIRLTFTRFEFRGTPAELKAYQEHLIAERQRFTDRGDWASHAGISKELQIIARYVQQRQLLRNSLTLGYTPTAQPCAIASQMK